MPREVIYLVHLLSLQARISLKQEEVSCGYLQRVMSIRLEVLWQVAVKLRVDLLEEEHGWLDQGFNAHTDYSLPRVVFDDAGIIEKEPFILLYLPLVLQFSQSGVILFI